MTQVPGVPVCGEGIRYVTHLLRLRNVERPLANFFASGVLGLREKLGPLLWQFPPSLTYDRERLEAFFELLPRSTARALTLARRRDARKVRTPFDALALMRRLRLAWRPERSNGDRDLVRHPPGARIPRIRGGLGPRVTGGSAWEDSGGSEQARRAADGPAVNAPVTRRPTGPPGGTRLG